MSSVLVLTYDEALGDMNKVAPSPPRGGGLQAQYHFSPKLRPLVAQIKLSLHNLSEVAWELNLSSHPGRGLG